MTAKPMKTLELHYPMIQFLILERLSMTLRQTANSKNETFEVRLQLLVHYSENICIFGE